MRFFAERKKDTYLTFQSKYVQGIGGIVRLSCLLCVLVLLGGGYDRDDFTGLFGDSFALFASSQQEISYIPEVIENENGTRTFRLYAPGKQVDLIGDFTNRQIDPQYRLFTFDHETFSITVPKMKGQRYVRYQFLIDNSSRVAHPFSQYVLSEIGDQTLYRELGLPAYPVGRTHATVSVLDQQRPWGNNYDHTLTRPDNHELRLYEIWVKTFSDSGDFAGVKDQLPSLASLGINAIQLMPIFVHEESEGHSRGYDITFPFALHPGYGTPQEFKKLVAAAHTYGIQVIVDVPYDHIFGQSSLIGLYPDSRATSPGHANPFVFVPPKHPYAVGFDLNHDNSFVNMMVKNHLRYMIEAFGVDGFRFDLSKGITTTQTSSPAERNLFDAKRVQLLTDYAASVRHEYPQTIIVLEHFSERYEQEVLAKQGFLLQHNVQTDLLPFTWGAQGKWEIFSAETIGTGNPGFVSYVESHDEERALYQLHEQRAACTTGSLQRLGMLYTWLILHPGPVMLWQGGEWGYDYSLRDCQSEREYEICKMEEKRCRGYTTIPERKLLHDKIASLLAIKKRYPIFQHGIITYDTTIPSVGHMVLHYEEKTVHVWCNASLTDSHIFEFFFSGYMLYPETSRVTMSAGELGPGTCQVYSEKGQGTIDN